ncbi:MAG: MBOAT family protein [Clostridia bacterium]|nr:MBOAT family protein [Clostridia bacterium]
MVFSSLLFLCIFLPTVLLAYNLSKNLTYKNIVLVISSLIFYSWGEPVWVLMLVFSAMVDYTCARVIDKFRGDWRAKTALLSSLIINLGILFVFKYSGFIVDNINMITGLDIPFNGFSLPLGISFYTFQTISYTIDVYRGDTNVQKSPLKYLTYLSMFPQLVAGPIVRYADIDKQINNRTVTAQDFEYGVYRFAQGMFKKVILANSAGSVATSLIGGDLTSASVLGAWLGMIMYTFQIYFDFSGYSDMAIGMGRFFGFKFLENFNYPYISTSVTEFWRRWHMSLSSFFRDYVYIPLGGNRKLQIRNILVVWMLTGFWHGASWNFILWGLYYGILLIVEKKLFGGKLMKLPKPVGLIYSSIIIFFGWTLFYFTDMSSIWLFLKAAFGANGALVDLTALSTLASNVFLLVLLFVSSTPYPKNLYLKITEKHPAVGVVCSPLLVAVVLIISFTLLVGSTYNPFLYFRF